MKRGTLVYSLGNTDVVVPTGAVVVVPEGVEHRTLLTEGGHAESLHLSEAALAPIRDELGPRIVARGIDPGLVFGPCFDQLARFSQDDELLGSAAIEVLLEVLEARLAADELGRVHDRRIARAVERAFDRNAPATVDELARAAGLSRFHFSREFKRRTGKSPHQFLLDARLRHAAQLLEAGQPVTAAATHAGFSDLSRFGQQFKRLYGWTPRRHAEQVRARRDSNPRPPA